MLSIAFLLLYLCPILPCSSFHVHQIRPTYPSTSKYYRSHFPVERRKMTMQLRSTESIVDTENKAPPVSSSSSYISSTTNRADAIVALEKLAKRQKEELQETVALLQRLSAKDGETATTNGHSGFFTETAASLLRGVDYGFTSRSEGAPQTLSLRANATEERQSYGPPGNLFQLGTQQFMRNLNAMKGEYSDDEADCNRTEYQIYLQTKLRELSLNTSAIWEREKEHGPIEAPWIIKIPYYVLCYLLDTVFGGKYVFNRFYLLETVARMPYFSYIGMLHIYETLGFWRRSSDVKRIHFAEELNEYRHLLIQESLGGDQQWYVRALAQHSAIAYFIALCFLWALSPELSYKFSEMLETHAVHTYGQFLDENEKLLKQLPPSLAAVEYYTLGSSDPFYAEFQTAALETGKDLRRPGSDMKSLYDVFKAIQADEQDHVCTMKSCLDEKTVLRSLSLEKQFLFAVALATAATVAINSGGFLDTASTSTTASDILIDDAAITAVESVVAGGVSLLSKLISPTEGNVGELFEEVETNSALLKELDILGAAGVFVIGARNTLKNAFDVTLKFFSTVFTSKK